MFDIIEDLRQYPIISDMVRKEHIEVIIKNLYKVLDQSIEGDVVELGCNVGTVSLFIRRFLDRNGSSKRFFVYDSFEGLPEKRKEDGNDPFYRTGCCQCKAQELIDNFQLAELTVPEIKQGRFSEITEWPDKIAFAFFDGDFYSSILDSFGQVYPKMTAGSRIAIHDYRNPGLPGVERACLEFLKDKPESIVDEDKVCVGIMIKE